MTVAVTLLPTPLPSRLDPATFADRADATLAQLNPTLTELNAQNAENNSINANVNTKHGEVVALAAAVADNSAELSVVTANIADIVAVADEVASVATVATNIANVNAVAANEANINEAVAAIPVLSEKVSKSGDTITGLLSLTRPASAVGTAGLAGSLQVGSTAATQAVITFRKNSYYLNLGLDSDNVFRFGGGSQGANTYRFVSDASGNFTATGNVTAYSDARLKTDFLQLSQALSKVCSLTGYTYKRIDTDQRQTGLVAQDVQKVLPEAVQEVDGILSIAYGQLTGLLVEAIKELTERVKVLEAKQ